jgi:Sortilin, neurotensin receptor 3,
MISPRRVALFFGAAFVTALAAPPLFGQGAIPVADEFERLHFRSIGPAIMSGRISDFAVYEANPAIFYVGTAHGGVWKTTSNGAQFTPLLQDRGLLSIGAVAVQQSNPNVVWVGTGESNNRQSTSWGEGLYKSTDGGKTFTHVGLRDSKHIGRIAIDPRNPDVVFVAATGPLFGPGGDRGLYKTTDGGKTWRAVIKGDADTGANDVRISYSDPDIMYASMYQRRRTACCVNGGGPGSAIFKSTDGGETWTKLTGGIPASPLGRISLDVYRGSANIVYAEIEGAGGGGGGGGGRGGADAGTSGLYRTDDGGAHWRKVSSVNPRPLYFSQVRIDPSTPDRVYEGGVKMQMTVDGGATMETSASLAIHDDIHAIWVDPHNSDHVLIGGDGGIGVSYDQAKTWIFEANLPVGLFYHVGYDMEIPYNVCGGMQDNYDWCGPSATRQAAGILNSDWFQIATGDGFVSVPDLNNSKIIYTETQDGNMQRRDKLTGESKSIRPTSLNVTPAPARGETYRWEWDTPIIISPNDNGTLLVAANKVFKSTDRGDSWTVISPDLTSNTNRDTVVTMGLKGADITVSKNDGVSQWPAIVTLAESHKQPGVYYAGTDDGNVSVSRDGGKSWQNITKNLPGFPTGGWVSKVAPSRYDAGTVYVTVDNHRLNDFDTYIWESTDFGASFHSLKSNMHGESVKTLTEDQRNPDVLYIGTETGMFLSLDRGKSWRRFKANLPTVRVDEITLHPRDNAMLVATHGRALFILDHLEPIQEYTAAHAASEAKLYTMPTALEWKSKNNINLEFWGHQYFIGENPSFDALINYQVNTPLSDAKLKISDASGKVIRDIDLAARSMRPGIQTVCWDMRMEPLSGDEAADAGGRAGRGGGAGGGGGRGRGATPAPAVPGVPVPPNAAGYLPINPCTGEPPSAAGSPFGGGGVAANLAPQVVPGTYTVALVSGGKTLDSKPIRVIMDPGIPAFTEVAHRRWNEVILDLQDAQRRGNATERRLSALNPQMVAAATKVQSAANVPEAVKKQFADLNTQFDSVRVKFGVGVVAPVGRGGGGGRGAADPANALARTGATKSVIMGIWETPSAGMLKQSAESKAALMKAIADADALMPKIAAVSQELKKYDIAITMPAEK